MSIASGTEILPGQREEWLEERRKGLGASECAAALGLSPFETALGLWARKTGRVPEAEESEAMELGLLLEPVVAELYCRRTGLLLIKQQVFVRAGDGPLCATLDAVNSEGVPVELKTLSAWKGGTLGEEETDELPDHWICQAQMQMHCAGMEVIDFAVLVGGQRYRQFRVERNQSLIEAMLPRLGDFWKCVETGTPPEAEGRDAGTLAAIWPGAEGEVELGEYECHAAWQYDELGVWIKGLQAKRDRVKVALLEAMGGHAVGVLPDGRRVRRTVTKGHRVEAYDVKESVRLTVTKPKEMRT